MEYGPIGHWGGRFAARRGCSAFLRGYLVVEGCYPFWPTIPSPLSSNGPPFHIVIWLPSNFHEFIPFPSTHSLLTCSPQIRKSLFKSPISPLSCPRVDANRELGPNSEPRNGCMETNNKYDRKKNSIIVADSFQQNK